MKTVTQVAANSISIDFSYTNQADDNPDGSIVEYTFDVVFNPTAVQLTGKLPTAWAATKNIYWKADMAEGFKIFS